MKNTRRILANLGITLKKPRIISSLIRNYIKLFLGNTVLRTIEIALTYKCQCRCMHCSAADLVDNKKKELDIKEIKRLIMQAKKDGAVHILFTGGETLMAKEKLLALLDFTRGNFITSIDTNGIMLDKKYAFELKKHGLDVACVSIDFMEEKEHDKFRDYDGCFKKAMDAVKLFRKNKIDVIISTLITKEKLHGGELYKILELAEKSDASVIFCLPILTGRFKGHDKEALDKIDMKKLEEVMKHPLARLCEENNYLFKGCAAGSEKIAVTLYGDVMPCSFIKERYGNIRQEKLRSILKRMRKKARYSKVNRGIKCLAAEKRE
ncbi:MAG: radical SAM protein [Nanoarchaeota archaeon]|nr:radical SAM protein [Nanoarchaeota archaeon]